MQIFVSGTHNASEALSYANQARLLGQLIAKDGFDLACGPGSGVARHIIDGYRSIAARGIVRFYLPLPEEMTKAGELVGHGADEIIQTELDYPLRNIYQVRASNGLFILTGGSGTLEEAITAVADYRIPVGAVRESGTATRALDLLLDIFPAWKDLVIMDGDVGSAYEQFRALLGSRPIQPK